MILAADASLHDKTATQEDISRIIHSIKLRDERILAAETEIRKITEEYRRLREELLPVFRMAKDRSQPLPYQPSTTNLDNYEGMSSPVLNAPSDKGSILSRKISTKALRLNFTPKTNSPTHMPKSIPEGKTIVDSANIEPTPAASAASQHLNAQVNGNTQPAHSPLQPNIPSPTSTYHHPPPYTARGYGSTPSTGRTNHSYTEELQQTSYKDTSAPTPASQSFDRGNPTSGRNRGISRDPEYSPAPSSRDPPSVEIFKSFRVSLEDPCWKVLPAALKKYNIDANWQQYSLYIVYGDQERCLGLDEKPLDLFKQLDKEGRKPMFMLRRLAAPNTQPYGGSTTTVGSFDSGRGLGNGRGHQSSIQLGQLPGGVL